MIRMSRLPVVAKVAATLSPACPRCGQAEVHKPIPENDHPRLTMMIVRSVACTSFLVGGALSVSAVHPLEAVQLGFGFLMPMLVVQFVYCALSRRRLARKRREQWKARSEHRWRSLFGSSWSSDIAVNRKIATA